MRNTIEYLQCFGIQGYFWYGGQARTYTAYCALQTIAADGASLGHGGSKYGQQQHKPQPQSGRSDKVTSHFRRGDVRPDVRTYK